MATNKIQIDEGSATNLATNTISEDAVTKHLNRSVLNKSDGSELGIVSNPIFVQATFATIPVVGNFVPAGGTLSVYQGTGTAAWRTTLATLPVVTNVTGYALEAGGNLDSIVTTLNSIKTKTDNLDVTLGSRLGSGSTLPITGTVNTLNAGGSLSAFQGGTWTVQPGNTPNTTAWLITQATLPVGAGQVGTWTVQPGNTPNTTAWLMTMATLPVIADTELPAAQTLSDALSNPTTPLIGAAQLLWNSSNYVRAGTMANGDGDGGGLNAQIMAATERVWNGSSFDRVRGGAVNNVSSATGFVDSLSIGQYRPTLLSLSDQAFNTQKIDLFGNTMVNTNVALPNSTRFNRFLTFASYASIMAAPGAGKRLVIREMDFSGNATLAVELYEDHAGTPARVWGPHYFLPYAGFIKPTCYIPITANKSLGINITGSAFNSTLDIRIETENV